MNGRPDGAGYDTEVKQRSPRRYVISAALAFAAGVCAAWFLKLPVEVLLWGALLVALAALPLCLLGARRGGAVAVMVLVALAGALNFAVRAAGPPPSEIGRLLRLAPGEACLALVTGEVLETRSLTSRGQNGRQLVLEVQTVGPPAAERPAGGLLRVTLWGKSTRAPLRPGDRLRVPLLLRRPGGQRSPGAFRFREYAAAAGVWTVGSGKAGRYEKLPAGSWSPGTALARLRGELTALVSREMPEREGPLLNTILLGERGGLPPEQRRAFTRTGTGHLLAVSGIHVMLLVGTIWWLLRALGVRPRPAAVVLICFALAYAQLTGARTPVVRAATMACLLLGGIVLRREADGPSSLAAAGLLIMAIWPRQLFSVGFQMSFAAVFFIMTAVPALERGWALRKSLPDRLSTDPGDKLRLKFAGWLRLSLFSSLAAAAGTMPLVVATFGVISPWSPIVNLLAIPAAGAALASGLALLVVGSLCPLLAPVPAAMAWGALHLLETIVGLADRVPGASLSSDQPSVWLLVVFYAVAALLLWPRLLPQRWRARAAAAALLLAIPASLSGLLPSSAPDSLRVTLPCFGRGRAAVLEAPPNSRCAIWAGGSGREVIALLRAERLGKLERVIITAAHQDVTSGAAFIKATRRGGRLTIPEGDATKEVLFDALEGAEHISPGWRAQLGEVQLEALGTEPYRRKDGRITSRPLMILASRGDQAILFADFSNNRTVKAVAEEFERRSLRADLIVLGFAWRQSRHAAKLIRLSGARLALVKFSAFENGEPAGQKLLKLLRNNGARPLVTHQLGTLRVTLQSSALRIAHFDNGTWHQLADLRRRNRNPRAED
jgi:competence protein ComEC